MTQTGALADQKTGKRSRTPTVQGSRWITLLFGVIVAGISGVVYLPGISGAAATLLGSDENVMIISDAGFFLVIVMGIALAIGWPNPYTPPALPDPKKMTGISPETGLSAYSEGHLRAEKILEEEFEYASKTAEQAMEHRMTIVNYYLLIVGGAGTGVLALIGANHALAVAAGPLLWLVSLFGGLSLLLLIALRRAWAGSIMEMNYIKEFFIVNATEYNEATLRSAFLWKPRTLPDTHRRYNVFHYSAILIAMLNSATFFGGIFALGYFNGATLLAPGALIAAIALTLLFFFAHLWLYDMMLIPYIPRSQRKSQGQTTASNEEAPMGARKQPTRPQIAPTSYTFQPTAQPNTVMRSEQKFAGSLVTLRVEEIRLPDGSTSRREIVEHAPAVVVIPYLEAEDSFLFIEQYRDAVGKTLLELPAGMVKEGEDPMAAAQRELLEETGYTATEMLKLSTYYTSPGFTNEQHHLYLATGLVRKTGIQDTREIHALHTVSRADAMAFVENDAIPDGKTVLGLVWADRRLPHRM
jgi:ADP-ribose pyrophosphatase